jgi:hypothetical protein
MQGAQHSPLQDPQQAVQHLQYSPRLMQQHKQQRQQLQQQQPQLRQGRRSHPLRWQ